MQSGTFNISCPVCKAEFPRTETLAQPLSEAEREKVFEEYNERVGEVVTGTVQRREFKNIFINLGKIEALLRLLEPFGIREIAQSGMVSLSRGPRGIGTAK